MVTNVVDGRNAVCDEVGSACESSSTQHRSDAVGMLAEIEALIQAGKIGIRFPDRLERAFILAMAEARIRHFTNTSLIGLVIYNSFLLTDVVLMPDIFAFIVFVQLAVVTPLAVVTLIAIHRRIIGPESGVTMILIAVFGSIILFYSKSNSLYSPFLIFTVPLCLAFGNVVLPLPLKMSVWFTGFCMAVSSVSVFVRPGWDAGFCVFAVLINVNTAAYMLIAAYRMEVSERRAYLFNRRETHRAELLAVENRQLQSLSETDGLTGVANRRCFDDALARLDGMSDGTRAFSLLLVDLDHFKGVNDTFGHQVGDEALRLVASCLKRHAPPDSIVARYGGEEFAVLLPGASALFAGSCAEALRSAVERTASGGEDGPLPTRLTVSLGFAARDPDSNMAVSEIVATADQALYRAKSKGRNRVEGWSSASTRLQAADLDVSRLADLHSPALAG